ncbi:hypothetical protein STENM327S_07815 [Streptomyces tendae]
MVFLEVAPLLVGKFETEAPVAVGLVPRVVQEANEDIVVRGAR